MLTRFHAGNLPVASLTVLSCGQNQRITVKSIWIANTHSGSVDYYINHVPSGGTDGISNSIAYKVALASGAQKIYEAEIYMEPGDYIAARASSTGHISMVLYADVFEQ